MEINIEKIRSEKPIQELLKFSIINIATFHRLQQ